MDVHDEHEQRMIDLYNYHTQQLCQAFFIVEFHVNLG